MKWTVLLMPALCWLGGSSTARAYVPRGASSGLRTEVTFYEAEKFTDARDGSSPAADYQTTLKGLREYFIQQASRIIPATLRLQITILDVDLAGDFEPELGASFDSIRIVKDLYPPRITLVFRVTDAAGNVLREGRRDLKDPAFMSRLLMNRDDPLRYEKVMIDAWLRSEFGPVK